MATNVNVYYPNVAELEALKAEVRTKARVLFLYKNAVQPDGNTIFDTLTEWATGGGRGYTRKELTNALVETARTASKWYVATNAAGKAEGAYDVGALTWTFNTYDVADGATVYGVGAFGWVLPFDAGAKEIKVGDTIKGATSGATGIVTGVCVQSGTWAAGTAAGYLDIMTKTGTFQDGENITIVGAINATSLGNAAGTGYAVGDIFGINEVGASGGKGIVLTVNAGAVLTFGIIDPGTGYTVANNKTTTKITGAGDDALTIDVDSLATTVYAVTNTGATADAHKRLLGVWAFAAGVAIVTDGQTITWDHKEARASGT